MKYFIQTYGCQYNEWDAARIDFMLQKIGFQPVLEKDADAIFIIACSVRKTAVDRLFGKIHLWHNKKIIVAGCVLKDDQRKLAQKRVIFWDSQKPEDLKDILNIKDDVKIANLLNLGATKSAFLPIMTGCDNFCTYCAVPYTRGREISRPITDIIQDFKALVAHGEKNITLLGQNVNSYQFGFAKLLKKLNDISGVFKIYFTSNHPKDMTDDVIDAIATLPKVAKQIHLPIQSGSDKILKAMNRPYTRMQYLDLVAKIKHKISKVELTTDTIVGFPGETEADFQKTVAIFKKVGYFTAYNNKYSPRAGTVAYKLGDPIPWSEKQRRWRILDNLANKK